MDLNILVYGFPAVLITMGLVQTAKKFIEARWIPLVSLIVGVALASLAAYNYWTPEALIKGLVIGLVAMGIWDTGKISALGK